MNSDEQAVIVYVVALEEQAVLFDGLSKLSSLFFLEKKLASFAF
jgi:hypothetical protein